MDRLERLAKLRADGALTEEEYAAQKAALLGQRPTSPSAASIVDGPVVRRRKSVVLLGSLAALAVAAAAGVFAFESLSASLTPVATKESNFPKAPPPIQPPLAEAPLPSKEEAFRIAYPTGKSLIQSEGMRVHVRFQPVAVHRLNDDTFVLLSVGQNLDETCHACGGFFSVAYFGRYPELALEGVPYIGKGSMGGWGNPPELALMRSLGPEPVVLVRSGGGGQGSTESSADLVQLGDTVSDVAIVAQGIDLDYDNGGNAANCFIDGKIRSKVFGKSFIVRYTGTYHGEIVYQRSGSTYLPPANSPGLWQRCPEAEGE